MKFIPQRPALYFLIPYLLGIVAGRWSAIPFLWLWLSILFSFIGSIATRNRRRCLSYVLLHLAVFAGGMLRFETAAVSPIPNHFYDEPISFSGTTTYQPERGTEWAECYAVGKLQLLSDPSQQVKAKVLIRFQELVPLRYGKQITLTGVLREPHGKRNPGGFDYKDYLARQKVTGILNVIGLLRIGEQGGLPPLRWIETLRIQTEHVIDRIYQRSQLHVELLKGILLGKRSDIPSETLEAFRNSGTVHVLAVSGLHVGLVALFCYFGLSRFRLPPKILYLLTIVAVLIYACLIGFRPSVFRAALLTVLFFFAKIIDRDTDLYNLLAFSALALLLFNPLHLFDVGFQLSFTAVLSIVYFVPKMEKPFQHFWKETELASEGVLALLAKLRNATVKRLILSYNAALYNLLAFSALALLLFNPLHLFDVGLHSSFTAVLSIVYFAPKMEKMLQHPWQETEQTSKVVLALLTKLRNTTLKWLILSYLVTFAAQIGTAPVIAYFFFRTYPLGIVVGPFAVGLVSIIVAIGIGSVCIGLGWIPLAKLLAPFNHVVISIFLALIGSFAQASGVVKIAPPTFGDFVLYIAVCLGLAHWRQIRQHRRIASLIGLSVLAIWVWDAALHERGRLLEVITLDVGQGDATVVRFPDNRTMLIDGGIRRIYYDERKQKTVNYDVGKRIIEPYLDYHGIRKLDMVVLTHPDIDHGGGLEYILEHFEVSRLLGISDMPIDSQTHQNLRAIAKARNIPYAFPYAGEIPLTPTATLNLLHPIDAESTNLSDKDKNDDSLVIKLSYGEVDVLFTGDIGKSAEARLIASGQNLRSEILKVPHHGSRTSSSAAFLDAVQPRHAIISLGKGNRYQLPHPEVVARYQERNCQLWRTDEAASITLRTDGARCWIDGLKQ